MVLSKQRGEVGTAAERLKAALTAKLQSNSGQLNAGLFQAIGLVNGFLFANCEDVQGFQALKEKVRTAMLNKSAPLPTTGVPLPTGQLTRSSSAVGAPRNSAPDGLSSFPGLQRNSSSAGSRNTGFRSTQFHEAQPRFQVQQQAGQTQQQPAERRQPKRPSKGFLLRQERERKKELLASRKNVPTETKEPTQKLSAAEIEAELNRMYAYGAKKTAGVDWTLPPQFMHTKAFAMMANDDAGNMIKMQDALAVKAEAARKQAIKQKQQDFMAQCDGQMEELRFKRLEEARHKKEMSIYMDNLIADNKVKDQKDKLDKEHRQEALSNLFSSQLKEKANQLRVEQMQLRREEALVRMQNAELERQEKERRERQAILNREKNEATKKHLDATLQFQAQQRAAEIEDERKTTKEYMKEMDRQEYMRQKANKDRHDKLMALFLRAGGDALDASMQEKAKKDKEKMILQQAAYEELMEEKDRQKRQAKEDRDRERKRIIDKQLADKAAGHAAEIKDMRRLKKALDVQQAAEREAAKAEKEALKQRQAESRERQRDAITADNQRRYAFYNAPMTDAEKKVHRPVIDLERPGFTNIQVYKHKDLPALLRS